MAVILSSDLVKFALDVQIAGWGYVYSGQGQLYTPELAEQWGSSNRAGKSYDYYVDECSRWFDKNVVDSSGLIIEALRTRASGYEYQTADSLYENSIITGNIDTLPEVPGVCVWRKGHIGIYIGDGKVIEAGGTNTGVVLSSLSSPATGLKWTNWAKLEDVDYTNPSEAPPTGPPPSFWLGRELKLTEPNMSGDDVTQVQAALQSRNFSPGEIDGVYGPSTKDAVTNYQQYAGLISDGVVDINTTYSLFGIWVNREPDGESSLNSFTIERTLKAKLTKMQGIDVKEVQIALKNNAYSPGEIDGIYGKKTKKAVKAFQKENGMKPTGIVDADTVNALGGIWEGN